MRTNGITSCRCSKWTIAAIVLVGALSLVIIVRMAMDFDFIERIIGAEEKEGLILNHQYIKEATTFSSLDDTAYVFLGLGATAHQLNCPAAVESLVRYGGWDGHIYMITDQANCFDTKKIVENAGMNPDKFHMIVLKEDFTGGGVDLTNLKVGFSKNRLRSKSMKTQLFDLIPDENIKVLAYVDCDILFGVEGCAKEYVEGGVPWTDRKIRFSRVLVDPVSGRMQNIHTGSIMMHREHSKEVLQRWYDRLNSGVDDMDRLSYLAEYNAIQDDFERRYAGKNVSLVKPLAANLKTDRDAYIAHAGWGTTDEGRIPLLLNTPIEDNVMMPSERIIFNSDTGKIRRFELFVNPEMVEVPCMTHVSKARCDSFGRPAVQKLVDRFRLRTYSQGYPYCPNPIVAPVLYGWVPLSYLPYCPKIEMFY